MPRFEFEQSPIEPRPIAFAKAKREYADVEKNAELEADIRDAVYQPQTAQEKEQVIKGLAVKNEQLLRVRNNKAAANEIKLVILSEGLAAFNDYTAEELQMSEENATIFYKRIHTIWAELFMEPIIDQVTQYHLKEFDEAEQLAKERATDIGTVYEDDTLYEEVVRRTYETPQAHAEQTVQPAVHEDVKYSAALYLKAFEGYRRAIILAEHGYPEEEAQRNAQELIDGFDHDPEFLESRDMWVDSFRRAHFLSAERDIQKYWGEEGLQQISPKIRHGIAYYKGK